MSHFTGYENSEIVSISSLKSSLGKTERTHQIEDALADKMDDYNKNNLSNVENMECSDRALSPGSTGKLYYFLFYFFIASLCTLHIAG